MNLFAPPFKKREAAISDWVARACKSTVLSLESCFGGRNNSVYRVRTPTDVYAVKDYGVSKTDDGAERLQREFSALQFLENIGFQQAPRPVYADSHARLGLYEFIEGNPVTVHTPGDIEAVTQLLAVLHANRNHPAAQDLISASAAHFSAGGLLGQIEARLAVLRGVEQRALRNFLDREFEPEFARWRMSVASEYSGRNSTLDAEITPAQRTLSPSDFGFHNVLRRPDETIVFLDFEYFGWDDPVNATGNFLWHPGFALSKGDVTKFETAALRIYGQDQDFSWRFRTLLPLYALRWALIALNEFLPLGWKRRRAAGVPHSRETVQAVQLKKATSLVAAARNLSS